MIITVKEDFRSLKKDTKYDFSLLNSFKYITIVGENGCGKSSLLQALRGFKNDAPSKSIYESDFKELGNNIEVIHDYEKIFYFDAVKDNGTDFCVAYDASEYVNSGGFAKRNLSHGQGSINDIYTLLKKYENKIIPNKTLLVLDEIDHGLSLKNQALFVNFIFKLIGMKCQILIISHNPFLISQAMIVYNFEKNKLVRSKEYLLETTGYEMDVPKSQE